MKRIYDAAKTEKANTVQFGVLKGVKRGKSVWFVFILMFSHISLSLSLSHIYTQWLRFDSLAELGWSTMMNNGSYFPNTVKEGSFEEK